jgi:chromosome partitioning protein
MAGAGEQDRRDGGPLVITAFNQKGGIGKTTTSVNLAVCLAAFGKRVVLVDLDSQGNATSSVGVTATSRKGAYDLINGSASLTEASRPTRFEGLSLCAATDELAGIDVELAHRDQSQFQLRTAVRAAQDQFDFIVIDCPPALGMLPVNALVASDVALMPVVPQPLAHDGLHKAWRHIHRIRENLNQDLVIDGILITFAAGDDLAQDEAAAIRREFGRHVLPMEVPFDATVITASRHDAPVVIYAPDAPAAKAYLELTQHFLAVVESRRRRVPIIARGDGEDGAPVPRVAVVPPDLTEAMQRLQLWRDGQKVPPPRSQARAETRVTQPDRPRFREADEADVDGWVAGHSEAPLEIDWTRVGLVAGIAVAAAIALAWSLGAFG